MSSSTTASDGNNVGSTGLDSATLAGIVSTTIAFLALIVSSIQLLYQYYTNVSLNALGARNCTERVMGPWAQFTRRQWRWPELRFETIFESPLFLVGTGSNFRSPILFRDIWYINGSEKSYKETRTRPLENNLNIFLSMKMTSIHWGENVEATWVSLLRTLQFMEYTSRGWESSYDKSRGERPLPTSYRSLHVGVQAQRLSWDFVPNFKKPFANTTICQIVEIAAMLGIYWTVWDSTTDRYRAEGNGCTLLGSFNAEQGIVFQFIRHGLPQFHWRRVIPHKAITSLCFGLCPTFFSLDIWSGYPVTGQNTSLMGLTVQFLKLGSRQEIVGTLKDIGCPIEVAEHFLNEESRVSHLFPVIFDIIGMLTQMVSARGQRYRMLPNPTIYRWERQLFRMEKLLLAFEQHFCALIESYATSGKVPEPLVDIATSLNRLSPRLKASRFNEYDTTLLEDLRTGIETTDGYLGAYSDERKQLSKRIVLETISQHVTTIVADFKDQSSWLVNVFPSTHTDDGTNERNYMEFLFRYSRWAATHAYSDPAEICHHYSTECDYDQQIVGSPPPEEVHTSSVAAGVGGGHVCWRDLARKRDITWCLLVFRMLCWLNLHTFHRDDVMIPKNSACGSEMPVYII